MVKEIRLKDKKKSAPQNKLEKMRLNQNRIDTSSSTSRKAPDGPKILPNPGVDLVGKFKTPNQMFDEMNIQN